MKQTLTNEISMCGRVEFVCRNIYSDEMRRLRDHLIGVQQQEGALVGDLLDEFLQYLRPEAPIARMTLRAQMDAAPPWFLIEHDGAVKESIAVKGAVHYE